MLCTFLHKRSTNFSNTEKRVVGGRGNDPHRASRLFGVSCGNPGILLVGSSLPSVTLWCGDSGAWLWWCVRCLHISKCLAGFGIPGIPFSDTTLPSPGNNSSSTKWAIYLWNATILIRHLLILHHTFASSQHLLTLHYTSASSQHLLTLHHTSASSQHLLVGDKYPLLTVYSVRYWLSTLESLKFTPIPENFVQKIP